MRVTRPTCSDDDAEALRDFARSFFQKECAPHE
jgi:hypothetical protein